MKLKKKLGSNKLLNLNKELKRKLIINISVIIIICLLLLILSLILKNTASNAYWEKHDSNRDFNFFWYFYDENHTEVLEVWEIEAYVDASYYYEPYLYNFRFLNWNPYAGGEGPLDGYAYGPIFIYGIYLISLFVGLFNTNLSRSLLVAESVKWTHIAFDSFCVVILYLILISLKAFKDKKVKKHIVGFLGASSFMLMPINLLYVDSIYLNIPQMTFFTMIAFLLFIKEKYRTSAFMLTIGWLSKQMPLFFIAPWFFILWKKKNLRTAIIDFLFTFLLTSFIVSLPWLFITPYDYLAKLFGPGKPLAMLSLESSFRGSTVSLAHSFLFLGSASLAEFYRVINNYMIPFLIFYIISLMVSYFKGHEIGNDESLFTLHTTWVILISHVFLSRGIYKYYDAFITPFILLIIILYLDKLITLLSERMKKKPVSNTTDIQEIQKNQLKPKIIWAKILQESLYYLLFFSSVAVFYYFNFIIITKSRFLHPLYLLILFGLVSVLFPPSILKSLFERKSYKMIKQDIVWIFRTISVFFKNIFNKSESKHVDKNV
ncbi:MAG: hypothetical protein KGD64_02375 [Candidatus Heimdallarchaeota archaeon]|nr:hypothetical protein [Candidatus Heimdallarchaeota archaeon]